MPAIREEAARAAAWWAAAPDRSLERAALAAGDRSLLDRLPEVVMWVNPGEVLVQPAGAAEPVQVWPSGAGGSPSPGPRTT